MKRYLIFILLLLLTSPFSKAEFQNLSKFLEKKEFSNDLETSGTNKYSNREKRPFKKLKSSIDKIKDLFLGPDWDIPLDIPPITIGKRSGLDLGLGYNYKTSYDGHTFVRTDTYKLGFSIRPGDLFQGLPLFLNISDKSELTYKRRFKSKWSFFNRPFWRNGLERGVHRRNGARRS